MNIEQQIEMLAHGPAHLEKVVVTRGLMQAILTWMQRKSVCPHCRDLPAFEIIERDGPAYTAMRQASIDRMHDMAAATRRPVL